MSMRLLTASPRYDGDTTPRNAKHRAAAARHHSSRVICSTPSLQRFLARADVKVLKFRSGWIQVWVGDAPFVGETLLAATELAVAAHPFPPSTP